MSNLLLVLATLVAFVVGFLLAFVVLSANYRKKLEAALSRENDLKAFYLQEQHQAAIRETTLQHDVAQAKQLLQDIKQELADLKVSHQELQLRNSRHLQELAAAKEKLQQFAHMQEQLQQKDTHLARLNAESTELHTRLEQERKNFAEQLSLLQNAKAELSKEFENIANKIFDNKQQQFTHSSKSLLETTLDPFKLQLSDFRKKVEEVYEKENADRNR